MGEYESLGLGSTPGRCTILYLIYYLYNCKNYNTMCLRIQNKFKNTIEAEKYFKNPLIAKEEIKVYKVLEQSETAPYTYYSPYQKFTYKQGYQYTENELTYFYDPFSKILEIHQGLHAYTTLNSANYTKNSYLGNNRVIIEMYIPKGSKYFLGRDNEIITNNLIWY